MRHFFPWSTLLLASVTAFPAAGQATLPPGQITPGALRQACAAQSPTVCRVSLAGEYSLALNGAWQVPRSMHLRFAAGSALHVSGGVLDFGGGTVDAPADAPIFPDADRVRGLAAARPEWFATGTAEPVPATAMAAAYHATEPWGTLYLQAGQYLSPFGECPAISPQLRLETSRTLVGAGRPVPDDPTSPTRLQGGTIVLGAIFGTAPLRLAHLGIDVGPHVVSGTLWGCDPPGIFIEQAADHQFAAGDRLEDVSVLTTGAFNMHSVMIAGHRDAEIRDLWIWSRGGTHGLVMKSSHSVVDGLHCAGAVSDCLIVKSDYATDFLGRAVEDRIAHVDIHPLKPGGYVGGIVIESRWDTVRALDMSDINETGTQFGITILGSTFYRPHDISIRRWTAHAVTGLCLFSDKADAVQVSDLQCGLAPAALAGAMMRGDHGTLLRNGVFRCEGTPAACAAGKTDAISDDATGTTLEGIVAEGLGGHLLRHARRQPSLRDVKAVDMEGRVVAPWPISWRDRLRDFVLQTKPNLRILYTAVTSRARFEPRLFALVTGLLALVAGWEFAYRRRRPVGSGRFRRV